MAELRLGSHRMQPDLRFPRLHRRMLGTLSSSWLGGVSQLLRVRSGRAALGDRNIGLSFRNLCLDNIIEFIKIMTIEGTHIHIMYLGRGWSHVT